MSSFRIRVTIDTPFVDVYSNTRAIKNIPIVSIAAPDEGDTLIFNSMFNTWGMGQEEEVVVGQE